MSKPFIEFLNRLHHIESPVDVEKPVWVYFNLHTGRWSIKQGGLVHCHAKLITLVDVEFRVREAGRLRVLKEQKKNVHAFVIGKIANIDEFPFTFLQNLILTKRATKYLEIVDWDIY